MKFLRILSPFFPYQLSLTFLFFLNTSVLGQNHNITLIQAVDSLVLNAIDSMAFPGAQVLIIHKNENILKKSYGYHTYAKATKVEDDHLYDLASVTKIMAGGLSLMKLQELNHFSISESLRETHPFLKKSNKADITWQNILSHQSRMQPYIVFWQKTKRKNGNFRHRTFTRKSKKNYNIRIDESLALHKRYPKKMKKFIKKSKLKEEQKYLYSGLGFLLIPELILDRTGCSLDEFMDSYYYTPMGLKNIGFQPYKSYPIEKIVPTELDTFFREKLVQAYVHDEAAAMLNGISANAGLFSNATDLGEIAKMLLNKGNYQNNQVLDSTIIAQYTSVQFPHNDNRRGLAFDKPNLEEKKGSGYIGSSASPTSFGHSGFTGTFMWMDPDLELIVILLSNRVHPYRSQRGLYSLNFRPKLHQLAYDYAKTNAEN